MTTHDRRGNAQQQARRRLTRWSIVIALVLATVVLATVVLATPLVVRLRDARASSFRSRFTRDRDALLSRPTGATLTVTESDLAGLPARDGHADE